MRASAMLALLAFVTIHYERRQHHWRDAALTIAIVATLLWGLITWGPPLVPPAPLRLASGTFGAGIDADTPRVTDVLDAVPAGGRVYLMTGIVAPLGLQDEVRHRWFRDGVEVYRSPAYPVTGGRVRGYRLWTYVMPDAGAKSLRVDAETAAGQLIGRVTLGAPR